MSSSPALFITAKPKTFRGYKVARSLSKIAKLSSTTKLGRVVDSPRPRLLKRQEQYTLKIFFDTPDDLVDFQRRALFQESLEKIGRYCKNTEQGLETLTL